MSQTTNELRDEFNGDDPHLIRCIEALLAMDADGVLRPHGVGGHARTLLSAAAVRLGRHEQAQGGIADGGAE